MKKYNKKARMKNKAFICAAPCTQLNTALSAKQRSEKVHTQTQIPRIFKMALKIN
jgi:hypothetical protein